MKRSLLRAAVPMALIAGSLLVPATANAAPMISTHNGESHACEVTGGTLSWGLKESFRSYVSSAIARGQWTTDGGATYETPVFSWSNPTGKFDPETGAGSVNFVGSVNFTGHEGVLNTTISNPTVEFAADGNARLLVDVKSNDPDGSLKVDALQTEMAILGSLGVLNTDATDHQYLDVATTLSATGAAGFGGFYEAGTVLDPISLNFTVSDCNETAVAVEEEADEEVTALPAEVTVTSETSAGFPWLPVASGAAIVVIAGAVTAVVLSRKKKAASQVDGQSSADTASE